MAFSLIISPVLRVVFPAFSRLQNDRELLLRTFRKANRMLLMIVTPMGVGLFLVGPEIATALFGGRWEGLGLVLSVIGLMFAVGWTTSLNPELYRAIGAPHVNAILVAVQLLYYLPVYYLAVQEGFVVFVYVRLAVACVALPMHIYVCCRMLGTSWDYLWQDGKTAFVAALLMGASVWTVKTLLAHSVPGVGPIGTLLVVVPVGAFVYAGSFACMDRPFVKSTLRLIRQAAS